MLKFLQFLQEKSPLIPPDFGGVSAGGDMDDNEVKPPIKTLGKETKKNRDQSFETGHHHIPLLGQIKKDW